MKLNTILGLILVLLAINPAISQDRAPSPSSKTVQKVGLTDITVEYSRPGMKERSIFADDGLAPFGKTWRTGANAATKITFSDDVKIAGQDLSAGSYAILSIPNSNEWIVNFYPYEATRWTTYRDAEPKLSVKVAPQMRSSPIENFVIHFDQLRDYSATMIMGWDKTMVPIDITVK